MADRSRQPYIPINRRNTSNSSKSNNPNPNSITDHSSREDRNPSLVGTCPFMCPVEERERRERLRDLAVFERLHGNPAKTSPTLAVKKFCRTINTKDVQTSDVRPVQVLEDTLNYLLDLFDSSDRPFDLVHDFIFDRTRSIRQDLTMQNLVNDQVIHMYQRMVKFHIVSHHLLRKSPDAGSTCHLNAEQLTKALTTLFHLYEENRASDSICHGEAEFSSFYLLLHLGSHNQGEPLSLWLRRVRSPIMKSREMCFARRMLRYYRLGNYKQFIRVAEEEASFLQYCVIEPYVNEVRRLALSCINFGGYKLQPYPLVHLSKILMMKESDITSLCSDCVVEISKDGLICTKQSLMSKPLDKYYPLHSERIERLCGEVFEL